MRPIGSSNQKERKRESERINGKPSNLYKSDDRSHKGRVAGSGFAVKSHNINILCWNTDFFIGFTKCSSFRGFVWFNVASRKGNLEWKESILSQQSDGSPLFKNFITKQNEIKSD